MTCFLNCELNLQSAAPVSHWSRVPLPYNTALFHFVRSRNCNSCVYTWYDLLSFNYVFHLSTLDVCGKFRLTLNIRTASTFRPKRGSSLEVKFVASLLTALRSWRGMMYLSKSHLARDILKPRKAEYFCSSHHQYPAPESEVL